MADCIITMKSMTLAEKAKRAASAVGISARIVNIDPAVTKRGCAYGLTLSCGEAERLRGVLERKHIPYGELMGSGFFG
ncbi:MAG: DUF3343 domain-containing protein [Ruminococcaceae bacterium]|nr:DUF3343 domain-containing protein [Oscillospiraceae bacterium]